MNPTFSTIALVGKTEDPHVAEPVIALARHLAARGLRVLVDEKARLDLGGAAQAVPEQRFAHDADLIVAVGGDGTMLYATQLMAAAQGRTGREVPLLGINRGRLGFLADISPRDMLERLDDVLAGRYQRDVRTLLEARIVSAAGREARAFALNDVVAQKWETGRMLDFETWINGRYVNTHGGDGMVVATSTGSTAYALSGGGPIIQPELDAIVLVPLCPHTLSDRPIVVRRDCEIEIRLVQRPGTKAQVTCDGLLLGDLEIEDRLLIGPAQVTLTLLHPPGHDYYRILRSKLHWGRGARHGGDQD
jgi:NAD+ kinase